MYLLKAIRGGTEMTMGFQEQFNLIMVGMKQKEFADKPIKTLGEVILLLEVQPSSNIVKLDFSLLSNPVDVSSYRGYYEDLAINYNLEAIPITVEELLRELKNVNGNILTGYKGGEYKMHLKTLVWVAQYGSCGRMLTDIKSEGNKTIICTTEDEE